MLQVCLRGLVRHYSRSNKYYYIVRISFECLLKMCLTNINYFRCKISQMLDLYCRIVVSGYAVWIKVSLLIKWRMIHLFFLRFSF